ncbi:polycystic kidney disease protein 1-like 2, partial [Diorhabda carinulata]|uniref:polycystic kidney disease protein 1-like 2 n=1 Tax=Diorhabda carinulata TaxID=1163345 RepID=UPI0025A2E1BB
MIDPYEFNDIQFLTVDVTDTLNPEEKSLDKQLTKRYYDKKSKFSIVNLLANKKYYELMQLLNVFADELEQLSQNANFKKTASLYKNKLLTALQSIPLTDVYLCKQAASIATKISLDEIGHQNPNVAWKATAVCVDAAKKTLDHYNKVQFVGSFAEEISDTGGLFAECTQVGLSTNHDVLKTRHILTTLSTPYPLLKIHAITEHYPDYFDDEGVSRNKMKLERSCQNLISLCALSTELLVTPLSPYQDGSISKYDLLEVIAIKKFGKDLQDFSISSLGTEVQPSKDFLNSKEVEISMCTTETNPFISINKEKIESPIAIIQFRSKKVITSFHHPFTISFKYAVNDSRYITHKGTTLRHTGKTKTKEDGKFEAMTMFQIDVIRNQSYFIVFTEFSQSINIYVTKFYKPTPAEFEDKCTEITEVGKTIFIENTMDYDHWDYLTVVPSTGKAKVNFKFRVFTYSCSSWQVSTRSWTNACGSSNESNSEKIVCKCYHSSVFSGKMKNNPVKEEHTLYTQHKLEVQASFIIFLSVLVLWILYCAFLTYLSFVKEKYKRQDIYFLSDIPSFYRYGYLVIVKTGNTGTTSNVMMKIYGTNTESKEHVLNFPDPDKKILRKGQEDWFFFATQYYLGDIKKIEIWFDSVGYRPSWECLEIEVVDLQLQKNWLFEINFKFDIKNSENHVFTAKPRNTERLSKRGIFLKKMKTGFRGPHPWNIFYKETSLSNIERLTIMLSIFITIYNIVLMFYGLPAFKQNDGLDYFCEYQFDAKIIWATVAASILTFLIHYPLVYLLRLRSENGGFQKHPKLHKYLIDVSNRICWFILIFIILVSMTMTLLFGFWVPHITSLMWLTTSIASVLVYSFLLENLARLIKGFLQKGNTRMKKIFSKSNTILHYVEAQRNNFYNMFGRISLRPYFKKVYKPLDKESVKERQHWEKQKEKLIETFEDIIMIGIYVFLLYIILVRDKDPMANISNLEMRDLIRGHHSNTYSEHILSTKEIQNYIQNTLIPSMQSPQWYDRYIAKDPGSLTDNSNKYIGIARLRQKRADNISCAIPSSMKFATNSCVSPFSTGPEYRTFSQKWGHISGLDGFSRLEFIWDYQSVLKTGTLGYTGKFASYSGGGYVAPLGRTMRNSYINFRFYKRNVWIDERTRCLFIEFLTYSANSNLFNNVKIIFEISPSGYILPNYRAQTAKLLLVGEESNAFTLIVLTFFSLIVISLSIRSINDIRKKKAIVFKDFWRLVDIVLITMTLICLFLYLKRSHEVGEFLNRVKQAKHNKFINYFYLFYAESALTTLAAILVFLATFRLWKLLRFMVIIKVVEKTLDIAAKFLLCLFILHLHLLLIFASAGYLLFGNQYYSFDSFPNSFMNLVLISLGFHSFDFESAASTLFLLFYCSYMIMSIIFLTVYITLITIYYGEAQRLYSDQQEYNVLNYVKGQCYYYKELAKVKFRKCRLKGGQDENWERKKHVFPKSDEHRYAKCLTLEKCKLRAMRQIALDCLRNFKPKAKFTEEDAELIKGTIVQMFKTCNDESKAIFFLSNLVGWKIKLIDD